jgi:hypothetical protein
MLWKLNGKQKLRRQSAPWNLSQPACQTHLEDFKSQPIGKSSAISSFSTYLVNCQKEPHNGASTVSFIRLQEILMFTDKSSVFDLA